MHLPQPEPEPPLPPAQSLVTTKQDITWGRPIFKAPSLVPFHQAGRSLSSPVFTTAPRFRASQRKRRQR